MIIWHGTDDAPRPEGVRPGSVVKLRIGSFPAYQANPSIVVRTVIRRGGAAILLGDRPAAWVGNQGESAYWETELGPFEEGDAVEYRILVGSSDCGCYYVPRGSFRVEEALVETQALLVR
jgi:hypothetical protein